MSEQRRRAMTLVELMVVIAIIVILMSLLLPAIQKAREAANSAKCASQLHQLGVAALAYYTDYNKFPPGYLGPQESPVGPGNECGGPNANYGGPYVGVTAFLMPYLEQQALHDQLITNWQLKTSVPMIDPSLAFWQSNLANLDVAKQPIPSLICPSAGDAETPLRNGEFITSLHFFNQDPNYMIQWNPWPLDSRTDLARSHYLGVAGTGGRGTYMGSDLPSAIYNGILTNRSQVRQGDITDGASNTLLFGESVGCLDLQGRLQHAWNWVGPGALPTINGLNPMADYLPPNDPGEAMFFAAGFNSRHPGHVKFCFADGSVRSLRSESSTTKGSPSWYVLQQLAGYRDGSVADRAALEN